VPASAGRALVNYRHAFHAGNFADVFKHALLAGIVSYLCRKDAPFRVVDTHAGIGVYDLAGDEASRTGEWRNGIGRLLAEPPQGEAGDLLAPYLRAVAMTREEGGPDVYPGSPEIVRRLARPQDRLTLVEKHPADAKRLKRRYARDARIAVVPLDGWLALNAYVPPNERRGLVLVDPPFEEGDDFARFVAGLAKAHAKWPGGIYAFWYPIKDPRRIAAFARDLSATGIRRIARFELMVHAGDDPDRLNGCGLVVVNPPFTLVEEARVLLPALARLLAQGRGGAWTAEWLAGE